MHQYPVFKALSNPTRENIIRELSIAPRSVVELQHMLNIKYQGTVSQHLGVLEEAGVVSVRIQRTGQGGGQLHLYCLERETIMGAFSDLLPAEGEPRPSGERHKVITA